MSPSHQGPGRSRSPMPPASSTSSSATSSSASTSRTTVHKHFIEKLLDEWIDPEGRARLFIIANLVASGMLVLGVIILALLLMGYYP